MRSLKTILAFIVLTVLLAVPQMGRAATLYVGPAETYTAIQAALDAGVDGDEIVVRDGTYTGALNKNLDFGGKAITLRSENGQESCIIDCESDGSGFYFHSGEGSGSVVNGFTIQNGNATSGGAIYCFSSSPTITNCTIIGNTATDFGGGICCNFSSPNIVNCSISENSADIGAGIFCLFSSPTITRCTVTGNAGGAGGGIYCDHSSSPAITNCVISGNTAGIGGGIFCLVSSPLITNCTIMFNSADNYGGGIVLFEDSSLVIINSILMGNSAPSHGFDIYAVASFLTISYSDVPPLPPFDEWPIYLEDSTLTRGDGNIIDDPLVDANYRLLPGSACIDAGDPDPIYNDPDRSRNDMGAFGGPARPCLYVGPHEIYTAIQPALDAAVDGDLIIVRDGTYTGALNTNLDFHGKAVTLCSESGPERCIIDCQNYGRGFCFYSGEGAGSVVDGFTIQNGDAWVGGGISCSNSSPTITNCIIGGNGKNTLYGGGIYLYQSSPAITNCVIIENYASDDGGGIACESSSPTITNCTISENYSSQGGGFSCTAASSPTITNCILWGDTGLVGTEVEIISSSLTVSYSDVQGGEAAVNVDMGSTLTWGDGNIDVDPLFAADYRLLPGSPCIDAGDPAPACNDPDGSRNDMGAFGGSGAVSNPDQEPPVITVPSDIVVEATGPSGAVVEFTVTAQDLADGPVDVVCTPASGSTFPLGATKVTCSATDSHGNAASAQFYVIVTTNIGRAGGGIVPASSGGTITTPDGSVTVYIPPGALEEDTYISVAETGTSYEITTDAGEGMALFGVSIQPEGTVFSVPATITFAWTDNDVPGRIDGTNIQEENVRVTKDNVPVTDLCKSEPGPLDETGAECSMDDNYFKVQVTSLSEWALVYIDEVGPVIENLAMTPNPVAVGSEITIEATADDSATGNTYIHDVECTIDDGSAFLMAPVDGAFDGVSEDVAVTVGPFAEAGVHEICVQGWDQHENAAGAEECALLAVYDPSSGFVTGGGWINSPAGAYPADPSLTGKANFGFVSKYQKGASTPTGQTEFQFKVADLDFHSDTYDWLVIAGANAKYKGVGTINGLGNYGFMLTAVDGDLIGNGPDTFRIKIWDKDNTDTLVYDNKIGVDDNSYAGTELGGGSIVIRSGK